jgi:molybdopterin synthase catalytic subunit
MITVLVSESDFNAGHEIGKLSALGGGAVASFVGQVRGDPGLEALELEHYPAMTDKALLDIANTADQKWALHGITIIHRVGKLPLGAQIVLVCTSSDHRQASLEACSYIMDRLKTDAPFWKKQWLTNGTAAWVEERKSDLAAAQNWTK